MDDLTNSIGIAVQEVQRNADRLGLVSTYRPGTVQDGMTVEGLFIVLLDGDFVPITAVSFIGPVFAGGRVMVMQFPPSGTYIISRVRATSAPPTGAQNYHASRNDTLASTSTSVLDMTDFFVNWTKEFVDTRVRVQLDAVGFLNPGTSGTVELLVRFNTGSNLSIIPFALNLNSVTQSYSKEVFFDLLPGNYNVQVRWRATFGSGWTFNAGGHIWSLTVEEVVSKIS